MALMVVIQPSSIRGEQFWDGDERMGLIDTSGAALYHQLPQRS
jgi:hypothetical protein